MTKWLDRFFFDREEHLASLDDLFRDCGPFRLGLFEDGSDGNFATISDMAAALQIVQRSPEDFFSKIQKHGSFKVEGDFLVFKSAYSDGTANDVVNVQMLLSKQRGRRAIIIIPHWNARLGSYVSMGKALSLLGFSVCILILPHHATRSMDSKQQVANNFFLNANLGTAIRSIRQSVSDLRSLIWWLDGRGYEEINLVGTSLGSCVASLTTAFEHKVTRCALLHTAGDFGETVWTGRATSHIRKALESQISLAQLKEVWSVISASTYVERFAQHHSKLLVVSGRRDRVVLPRLTMAFVEELRRAKVDVEWHLLPCGHYTLGKFPSNIIALALVLRFFAAKLR